MTASEIEHTDDGHGLSHRTVMAVLAGLMLGSLLAALDQMIVVSVLRTVADQLHGLSMQAWATTAYLTTSVVSAPLYGRLSDIHGRKPLYVTAILLFLTGSVLTASSSSMHVLAVSRAVQGLGAGGLIALSFAILADMLPVRRRTRYQAYFVLVFGFASVAGPLVGGFFAGMPDLLGIAGWRWAFLINVPIGVAALTLILTLFTLPHTRAVRRIDYGGAVTLVLGLVPLLIVADQGRRWGWGSVPALSMFALGVAGLVAFVLVERSMGDEALLPPRLFRTPLFSVTNSVNVFVGMGVFGVMSVLPLYLQLVRGLTPTGAGLMLLPQALGVVVAGRLCGSYVARTRRYKKFLVSGVTTMAAGTLALSRLSVDTPLWSVGIMAAIVGVGTGLCFQTMLIAIQSSARPADMGVASSSYTFVREIGGTAGTAIYLSILFAVVGDRIAAAFDAARGDPAVRAALADPRVVGDPATARLLDGLVDSTAGRNLDDSSFLGSLDARLARPVVEGLSSAMNTVFLTSGCVLLAGVVLASLLREKPVS